MLHAVERIAFDALDRGDLAARSLPRRHQACAHERAVEVDRAGAALALLASVLRPVQPEPLAQKEEQALAFPHALGLARASVDGAGELHAAAQAQVRHRRASTASACRR